MVFDSKLAHTFTKTEHLVLFVFFSLSLETSRQRKSSRQACKNERQDSKARPRKLSTTVQLRIKNQLAPLINNFSKIVKKLKNILISKEPCAESKFQAVVIYMLTQNELLY